jgi:hypothetical protein
MVDMPAQHKRTRIINKEDMMKIIWTVILIGSLIVPSLAMAQQQYGFTPQDWEFTLQGTGTSDDELENNTLSLEFSLGYFLSKNLELGLRQGIGYSDPKDGNDTWNASTRGFADYHIDLQQWQPFLGVNFGYLYGDDVNESWTAGPEVGVKYFVKPNTFIHLLVEYNATFDDADTADEAFDDGRFVYALGMGIAW